VLRGIFVAERGSSSRRAVLEAKFDDIINIMYLLDSQLAFTCFKCVACNLNNLPKFHPEEINIAAIVDRQARVNASIQDTSSRFTFWRPIKIYF